MFEQQWVGWMVRDIEAKIYALSRAPTIDEVKLFAREVADTHQTEVLSVEPDADNPGRFKITSQSKP